MGENSAQIHKKDTKMELISTSAIIALEVLAVVVATIFSGLKIVGQTDIYIVERLGKYHKSLYGGLNLIIPYIDRVVAKVTSKEQLINMGQQAITNDNVSIFVDGIVFVTVMDAKMATYGVTNYQMAIENLAVTTLRGELGKITLDEAFSNRDKLNAALQVALGEAAFNWGVKIMRVEISEISVGKDIQESMNQQMKAERDKRAIELKAEAEKQAQIRNAEAYKQEQVLQAEAIERMADARKYEQIALAQGQADAIRLINDEMKKSPLAAEFLLTKDRISAFTELSKSTSKDKVIVPYETAEFIGSLSVIKDFLKDK